MNQLLDVVGDDEHELADLLELLGQLIEDHESTALCVAKYRTR